MRDDSSGIIRVDSEIVTEKVVKIPIEFELCLKFVYKKISLEFRFRIQDGQN